MATVTITARRGTGGGRDTVPSLMVAGTARTTQVITSSGSNQVSTVIGRAGEVVTIACNGNPVEIADAVGADPNAATTPRDIVSDGGRLEFYCADNDSRFAVVDL